MKYGSPRGDKGQRILPQGGSLAAPNSPPCRTRCRAKGRAHRTSVETALGWRLLPHKKLPMASESTPSLDEKSLSRLVLELLWQITALVLPMVLVAMGK